MILHLSLVKNLKFHVGIIILLLFISGQIRSQNKVLDSLLKAQETKLADTSRVDLTLKIATIYSNEPNDTAVYFGKKALALSKKINDHERIGNSFLLICTYYSANAKFNEAYKYLVEFENYTEETGDTLQIIKSLTARALLYRNLNQLEKVIEIEYKKAALYHSLKNDLEEGKTYYVVGWTGYNAKKYEQAVIDLHKGRAICQTIKEDPILHKIYNWLGASHNGLKQFDSALYYAKKVMVYNASQNWTFGVAESYRYTGDIYYNMKQFDTALAYYNNAIPTYIASNSVGRSFLLRTYKVRTLDSLKRYKEAAAELDYVFNKSDKKDVLVQMYANAIGRNLYAITHEPYKALDCYRRYDSIMKSSETDEAQQNILIAEFKKEQEKENALKEAEKKEQTALFELENHKQKNVRNILIAGSLIILIVALFIFQSLRRNKKTNKIITLQKSELEEKNKSIIDSINYAKRIQKAQLPTDKYIAKNLEKLKKR